MSIRELKAEPRQRTGSGVLNQMRREGYIPCVVYGKDAENKNLKVVAKTLNNLLKGASSSNILLNLNLDGSTQEVFLQGLQFDALKQEIVHADFLAVTEETTIKANIPLVLSGTPKGVKIGGLLDQMLYKIPVKCLPKNLPETLSTDVEHLDVGEAHHIGSMQFPEGVKPSLNEKVVVAIVAKTRVAQSSAATEEA